MNCISFFKVHTCVLHLLQAIFSVCRQQTTHQATAKGMRRSSTLSECINPIRLAGMPNNPVRPAVSAANQMTSAMHAPNIAGTKRQHEFRGVYLHEAREHCKCVATSVCVPQVVTTHGSV